MQNENPSRKEILLRKRKNVRYDIIWGYVFKLKILLQEIYWNGSQAFNNSWEESRRRILDKVQLNEIFKKKN